MRKYTKKSNNEYGEDNVDLSNAIDPIDNSQEDEPLNAEEDIVKNASCYSKILDIKDDSKEEEAEDEETKYEGSSLESILYKLPIVEDPIMGTPKEAQKRLDKIALRIQNYPHTEESDRLYNKIHLYMHGYLINVALKQFPYIKGFQTVDIYQESLIALRFKAIPNFKIDKGMSFLNFSKMCIRRHLITLLNTSKKRKKDQSMNNAISIDTPITDDENNTIESTLHDNAICFNKVSERKESFDFTKNQLMKLLSEFEREVLDEYLMNASYEDIAKNISRKTNKRCIPKTVDNALLRIRKKAIALKIQDTDDNLPMFI